MSMDTRDLADIDSDADQLVADPRGVVIAVPLSFEESDLLEDLADAAGVNLIEMARMILQEGILQRLKPAPRA